MNPPPLEFGQRFGAYRVIGPDLERTGYHTLVLCDCGRVRSIQTGQLRAKLSLRCKSCENRRRKREVNNGNQTDC